MVVMRDVVMMGHSRFSEFLKTPGLTPRVLSRRLHDLVDAGYLKRHEADRAWYTPTERGQAVGPVLRAIASFGLQYHAEEVFADGQPRTLEQFLA